MNFPLLLQNFAYKEVSLDMYIPDAIFVQQYYLQQKALDDTIIFPYWAKVWPAAYALAEFIIDNKAYIKNKHVVELAAGLALPTLVAAKYAQTVSLSDFAADAITITKKSVEHNKFTNVNAQILNWKHLPANFIADVILMSDINYEPENFDSLYNLFESLLNKNIIILLSTPQRLIATTFIKKLHPFIHKNISKEIMENSNAVAVSVFVLRKPM